MATSNDPFEGMPQAPGFTVTSTSVEDGKPLPAAQMSGMLGVPGGRDASPQLSWRGAPDGTRSYAVTVSDPDAPSTSRTSDSRRRDSGIPRLHHGLRTLARATLIATAETPATGPA